ncbi:MAG: chalcone isomerase family protein [Wenzhouxiangella sp.]
MTFRALIVLVILATGTLLAMPAKGSLTPGQGVNVCSELELRVAGLFRVGTAYLYLDQCENASERILDSIPKQFSLRLARSFSGEDLADTARTTLKDNLGLDNIDELPETLACMAGAYVDADDGDRYDVIYQPGEGLAMFLNDELLKTCEDSGDAAKYFMIWFGEQPFHRRMRDRLLQQADANS